jgi:hypothetical protein
MNPDGFDIDLMFPDEYSDFIAEITYKLHYICTIEQERGPGQFDVSFRPIPESFPITFKLSEFEEILEHAKKRLHDLRRSDS